MMFARQLSHLLAGLISSSRQFAREWKRARETEHDPLAGRWQGEWKSNVNGHAGPLRCVLLSANGLSYAAIFHAVYWKVLRVSYSVVLEMKQADDHFTFQGETDLGKLAGGVYRFEGTCNVLEFNGTYENQYDHGTLQMTRLD